MGAYACILTKSLQLCLTLCNPGDCSPPYSSVHGILQARILDWVVIPSSKGSSRNRDQISICVLHWQAGYLPLELPGKPKGGYICTYLLDMENRPRQLILCSSQPSMGV